MQRRTGWPVGGVIAGGILSVLGACSSVDDGKPDTGYGAGQAVPATENCADLCRRLADCAAHLCNEDKNTTQYLGSIPLLESMCQSSCTEAQLTGAVSQSQWQCVFHDSCRMVFGNGSCGTPNSSYLCG